MFNPNLHNILRHSIRYSDPIGIMSYVEEDHMKTYY